MDWSNFRGKSRFMKEKSSAFRLTMPLFAVATLLPAALMLCGVFFGGGWVWLGFLYMGGLALVLDQVIPLVPADDCILK